MLGVVLVAALGFYLYSNTLPPANTVTLSFDAWDAEDVEDGLGELAVYVNGVMVDHVPHINTPEWSNIWVSHTLDLTAYVEAGGSNTVLFKCPQTVNALHWSTVANVMVESNGETLFVDVTEHVISGSMATQVPASQEWTFTFNYYQSEPA